MGLATIESTPRYTKSLSLVQIDPIVIKIQPFKNVIILQRNVWPVPAAPASHTFLCKILTFTNGCILLMVESVYTKLGDL